MGKRCGDDRLFLCLMLTMGFMVSSDCAVDLYCVSLSFCENGPLSPAGSGCFIPCLPVSKEALNKLIIVGVGIQIGFTRNLNTT